MIMQKNVVSLILPWVLISCSSGLEQNDITFIVAGKTANYRQADGADPYLLNYHFFAEIFPKPDVSVTDATLLVAENRMPEMQFDDLDFVLEVHGGRYRSEEDLNGEFPNGAYTFNYRSPGLGGVSQIVQLGGPQNRANSLPMAPKILLFQAGERIAPDMIDPDLDLTVRWSEFTDGRADPNGVMDDLVFVIMGDCMGERTAHSGRPFENRPYLTYQDTQFTISADKFASGNTYQLLVEHAVLDTGMEFGVPAFATFATTTFLDIKTSLPEGDEPGACGEIIKGFDAGQTDRPQSS